MSVALLTVNMVARTRAFIAGMTRARIATAGVTKSVTKLSVAMKALVAVFVAGIALKAVTNQLMRFVSVASAANEIANKFNVVMGNFAESTKKWAITLGDATGRATQDVKKWLAQLQDTFVPMGFARDQALALSKSLVTLGIDLGSFNDRADPEVINLLTSAIAGNHRAVRSMGIVLSEVGIVQEAWNIGLKKNFKELTVQEKAMLRYRIILRSSIDAQGDAVRTAGAYANQLKRLSANLTELSEAIGKKLLPAVTAIITEMNRRLQDGTKSADEFGNAIKQIAKSVIIVGATISGTVLTIVGGLSIVVGLIQGLLGLLLQVQGAFVQLEAIVLRKAGFEEFGKSVNQIGEDIRSIGDEMKGAGGKSLEFGEQNFKALANSIGFAGDMIDLLNQKFEELEVNAPKLPPSLADPSKLKAAAAAQAKLISHAGSLFDKTRTATEKYGIEIGKLDTLLDKGIISWDLYARGVRSAREELEAAAAVRARDLSKGLGPASAQEIRSAFVSVTGLSIGPDPVVNELKLQTVILEEMNSKIGILSIEEALV